MTADSKPQFKQPLLPPNCCPAQEDKRLDANILHLFATDNLFNIYTKKLVLLVFHLKPEWANIPIGAAHANDIYRANILIHCVPTFPVYDIIIVHLFALCKRNFVVVSFLRICYNNTKGVNIHAEISVLSPGP